MIVKVTEIDPICAMQACMDGFEVVSPYINGVNTENVDGINKELMATTDLLVTTTGNVDVCDKNMIQTIAGAVICNIGHFDNEIDTAFMREKYEWQEVKPQVTKSTETKKRKVSSSSEGRLVNLGNATGHPSRIGGSLPTKF